MKTMFKGLLIVGALFVSFTGYSMYCYKHASKFELCVAEWKAKSGTNFWQQDKGAEYLCSQPSIQGIVIKAKGQ